MAHLAVIPSTAISSDSNVDLVTLTHAHTIKKVAIIVSRVRQLLMFVACLCRDTWAPFARIILICTGTTRTHMKLGVHDHLLECISRSRVVFYCTNLSLKMARPATLASRPALVVCSVIYSYLTHLFCSQASKRACTLCVVSVAHVVPCVVVLVCL